MNEHAGGALPIAATFVATKEEEGEWRRAIVLRQNRACGQDLAWYAYLGSVPVGFAGGFAALALGVEWRFASVAAMLIGLAYFAGHYACHLSAVAYAKRLIAADGLKQPEMTISVGEDGVLWTWQNSRLFRGRGDLTDLTRERGLLIFWTGASYAIFLPQRALAQGEEAQILRLARARILAKPNGSA
jgi:hypothetical protein